MGVKKHWTQEEDANVRLWCSQGISYTEQALRIGVHRDTVAFRARRIGVKMNTTPLEPTEEKIRRSLLDHPGGNDWDALPAGHPITWGALTRGTWLEGTRYPTA